ncbi:MAG: hypothetical protein M1831_005126 [Alyxoria varia]|nr:MAG: hypothetical protein M1831_005126 [Alyxoria varia]
MDLGADDGNPDEPRGFGDRERSRSPRAGNGEMRDRSASRDGRDRGDRGQADYDAAPEEEDEESRNTGSNLFVTGIHPRLAEEDIINLFEKFGQVEKCNIMRDPHSKESRGFGFVNMVTSDQADAAKESLQGEVHEGRTLSIEKARRSKPRTPTPGKYFGPPKHDFRGRPRGRYGDRFEDRRGGIGRRDDHYGGNRGSRYDGRYDRYDDRYERSYDRPPPPRRDRYDERPPIDRYASGREDRYGGRRGGDYYDRPSRRGPPTHGDHGARDYGSRTHESRPDDRFPSR